MWGCGTLVERSLFTKTQSHHAIALLPSYPAFGYGRLQA